MDHEFGYGKLLSWPPRFKKSIIIAYSTRSIGLDSQDEFSGYINGPNSFFTKSTCWPSGRHGSYYMVILIIRILENHAPWTYFEQYSTPLRGRCTQILIFLKIIYFTKTTMRTSFLVHFILRSSKIELERTVSKLFPQYLINEIW